MKRNPVVAFIAAIGVMALASASRAEVRLASLFADHMVLQQGMAVPVWGWADPGQSVTVSFVGQSQSATAGTDGKWMVKLASLKTSNDPADLTVAAGNTIALHDILVGEVWLASGQSNMVFPVARSGPYGGLPNADAVIAAANLPTIRIFTGQPTMTYEPQREVAGSWIVASPETAPKFSAASYLFARNLQKELNVPVGMITLAQGASVAEGWISRQTLLADPKLRFMVDSLDENMNYFRANPRPAGAAPLHPTPINKPRTPARGGNVSDPMRDQHFATILYNGMIAPVVPYAVRGIIWYQGESICFGTPGLNLYGHVMQTLVNDWRKQWGQADLPFYIVQLPGQANISNNPRIREEQATILQLPHTGFAVTIDTGEQRNVHPVNKEPVGERLTRLALADAYGRKIDPFSPLYDSMRIDGSVIRIKFAHATGGLLAKGGPLKGFEIAGEDKNFVAADARIDGNSVIVTSPQVKTPVAVRYAFVDYPEGLGCNLYNADNLPAAPFRTDQWDYPIKGIVEN
ncbi:MAG TPA: sialate O-acetylesterase [Tepidisphaeraceae bacterium]|nr:sialate O-acetylesterase [Tepidisphaeraceae bacterium]